MTGVCFDCCIGKAVILQGQICCIARHLLAMPAMFAARTGPVIQQPLCMGCWKLPQLLTLRKAISPAGGG
jgi:hypothetical protein